MIFIFKNCMVKSDEWLVENVVMDGARSLCKLSLPNFKREIYLKQGAKEAMYTAFNNYKDYIDLIELEV